MSIQERFEQFQNRWSDIHATRPLVAAAGRKPDSSVDDMSRVPNDKIERVGKLIVYPNPSFPGRFDVRTEDNILVSFCGEFAHRNAINFARKYDKLS